MGAEGSDKGEGVRRTRNGGNRQNEKTGINGWSLYMRKETGSGQKGTNGKKPKEIDRLIDRNRA